MQEVPEEAGTMEKILMNISLQSNVFLFCSRQISLAWCSVYSMLLPLKQCSLENECKMIALCKFFLVILYLLRQKLSSCMLITFHKGYRAYENPKDLQFMNPIFRDLKTSVYVLICAVFKYLIDRRMSSILKANIPPYLV